MGGGTPQAGSHPLRAHLHSPRHPGIRAQVRLVLLFLILSSSSLCSEHSSSSSVGSDYYSQGSQVSPGSSEEEDHQQPTSCSYFRSPQLDTKVGPSYSCSWCSCDKLSMLQLSR